MSVKLRENFNKYDLMVILLIFSFGFGNLGGAIQVSRVLAILFAPIMINVKMRKNYVHKNIIVLFVVFYLFCIFSLIWTPDLDQAIKELVYYPVHFLIFLEIVVFSFKANKGCESISIGWMSAVFFCSIIAYWEITTGNHLQIANEQGGARHFESGVFEQLTASVTFGNYNSYVTFLCFSFPWLYYLVMSGKSFLRRIVPLVAIVLAILVILFDASRGGILTFLVMTLIFVIKSSRSFTKYAVVIFFTFSIIYVLINYGGDTVQIIQARAGDGASLEATGRQQIWKDAFQAFLNSFFIGTGLGSITKAMEAVNPNGVASPHNMFLEFLTQFGLFFFIPLLLFLLRLLILTLKKVDSPIKIALLMALIALPLYAIIDSVYLLSAHLYGLLGTIYYFVYKDRYHLILQ